MKHVQFLALLAATALIARAEDAGEAAIRTMMKSFGLALAKSDRGVEPFFAAEAELWDSRGRIAEGPEAIQRALARTKPWSEVAGPYLELRRVRLVGPGAAMVEATLSRYGSTIAKRSWTGLIVLRKEGERWLILSCVLLGAPWHYVTPEA